ncbi:MAG: phosphatase PAP2 family protein [Acidimicrobiales bacterium]
MSTVKLPVSYLWIALLMPGFGLGGLGSGDAHDPDQVPEDDSVPSSWRAALFRTARWIVPAYALVVLVVLGFDRFDPGVEPNFDLTGPVALIAWVFAESGQTFGIVAMATILILVMVTRPGLTPRRRVTELVVMAAVSLLVLYGGKLLNDHVVKPAVGVARPNIVQLADSDLLGMDVESFYELTGTERSEYLDSIKNETGFGELVMRPEVRDHWVKETAFARPSGHSLASMTFATFYVSMAIWLLSGWRRWPFYLLVPWAVCVCLSRAILSVHWPVDIVLGGFAGVVVGTGAFLLTQFVLRSPGRQPTPDLPR